MLVNRKNSKKEKAEAARILEVVKTGDPDKAAVNLGVLLQMSLIVDPETKTGLQADLSRPREKGTGLSLPANGALSLLRTTLLLRHFWITTQHRKLQTTNAMLQKAKSDLHVEALPPPTGSPWEVYVGQGHARAKAYEARKLCCNDNAPDDAIRKCCKEAYAVRVQ